jgi:hypothetical protein
MIYCSGLSILEPSRQRGCVKANLLEAVCSAQVFSVIVDNQRAKYVYSDHFFYVGRDMGV